MSFQIGVVGGSGYTGAELLRLLHAHLQAEVVLATGDSNAGARVASLYPSLAAAYPDLAYTPVDPSAMAGLDLVFVALPHGASQQVIPDLLATVPHVVDLGADFRLADPQKWETYYGGPHAGQWTYGLPEVGDNRAHIASSTRVSNPGCYATGAIALLRPLVDAGLVPADFPVALPSVSGYSGGGIGFLSYD